MNLDDSAARNDDEPAKDRYQAERERARAKAHDLTPEGIAARKAAAATPSDSKVGVGCLVLVVVVILVVVGIRSLSGDGGTADAERSDIEASIACEDLVKRQLKSPGSADFSGEEVAVANEVYTVDLSVDSENSFGASLRSEWRCVLQPTDDDGWRSTSVVRTGGTP